MADRDIEQVADLYADPHPGDTAPRWLTARLGETGQAESEIPATVAASPDDEPEDQ